MHAVGVLSPIGRGPSHHGCTLCKFVAFIAQQVQQQRVELFVHERDKVNVIGEQIEMLRLCLCHMCRPAGASVCGQQVQAAVHASDGARQRKQVMGLSDRAASQHLSSVAFLCDMVVLHSRWNGSAAGGSRRGSSIKTCAQHSLLKCFINCNSSDKLS